MEAWRRIQTIMEEEGLNKNSFSKAIGMTNNVTITRIINEKRSPSRSTCEKIAKAFPKYNLHWMLTGEGNRLNGSIDECDILCNNDAKIIPATNFMNVPLIPVRASAGYLTGYGDTEYIDTLPTIPVIVDRTYHGRYRCFEVDGDSMDDGTRDAICDKDIVLGREVKQEFWKCKLHIYDWDFIIIHKDGVTIKRIIEHDTEAGIIKCHPLNPMYNDFELSLNEVYELYNVIKIVDRSTRR